MSEAVNVLMLSSQSRCEWGWVPAVPGAAFRDRDFQLLGLTSSISQILAWIQWQPWGDHALVEALVNAELAFTRCRGRIPNDAGIALTIKQLLGDIISLLALEPDPQTPSICSDKAAWHCVADRGSALVLSAPVETTPPEAAAMS